MTNLYNAPHIERLRCGAQSLVTRWGLSQDSTVRLLTVSENATFRADDPTRDAPLILRVHRPGYHTQREINSELQWIHALRSNDTVRTPRPVPLQDGSYIAAFDIDGTTRDVVAFEYMEGLEPSPEQNLENGFRELGAITATLHAHTRGWKQPPGFTRKTWNFATTVGPAPHWGDWRHGLGLTTEGRAILENVASVLRQRLSDYGETPDRFGLIHADLRLANLLIDERDGIGVIDFDDCGFGWFMYDFAAAVSFFEHEPVIPTLQDAWVAGYRSVSPLSNEDEFMLPTFVMLRRLLLTAWIASHAETPTAQELGAGYTDGTVALGQKFLRDVSS